MTLHEILQWQWDGYTKYHQSRLNLWLHMIFVPVFIFGFMTFFYGLATVDLAMCLYAVLCMAISFGIQGFGHSKEPSPAIPFSSLKNALIRIIFEQIYTFPKFVISGRWYMQLIM